MFHFYLIGAIVLITLLTIFALHRQIDALLLGDESAASLGVNVDKLRIILLALCAAVTATIVAYCGGIGFVGSDDSAYRKATCWRNNHATNSGISACWWLFLSLG